MRFTMKWIFAVVCLWLLAAATTFAQSGITVNEAAIRIQLAGEGVQVDLPVQNATALGAVTANVSLELLNLQGVVVSQAAQPLVFPPGKTRLKIALPPIAQTPKADASDLVWFRLRYSVTATAPGGAAGKSVGGIISASEATPELFELHVAGSFSVKPGSSGTLVVRAVHPVTLRPIEGVKVQATLDVGSDDGKTLPTKEAMTDRRGFATLSFSLPSEIRTNQIQIRVTGKKGNLSAQADGEIAGQNSAAVRLSTDKSLYQPGQTVHVRLMAFDPNNRALAKRGAKIQILDEEDGLVFRTDAQTSRFGVAFADWNVPDNQRLGTYEIRVELAGTGTEERNFEAHVKISRYDLPSFSVRAKLDRAFYLTGQNATVDVGADYLFGEPVSRGHVRVVRETERQWNFREQKWDTKEEQSYEGDTDDRGNYAAQLDLANEQNELASSDYDRFRDLSFAAYFTDSSTGKTEERRFDVRISREPIHIYMVGYYRQFAKGMPLEFYLSADYADGTPAECDVDIDWSPSEPLPQDRFAIVAGPQFLKRVHTNRYGIAKVTGLNPPSAGEIHAFDLTFRARDRKGASGHQTESVNMSVERSVRVKTDKMFYSPGDPITVDLTSNEPESTLVVEAGHNSDVLARQFVRLHRGRASLVIPSSEHFQNEVTIVAFLLGGRNDSGGSEVMGFHNVYFPKKHGLSVDVHVSKNTYKPGEEASAVLQVSGPDGNQRESALGLVVVDKAEEEREKTDTNFFWPSGFYGFRNIFTGDDSLKGIHLDDLDKLDLSKPVPDGWDLVAEAMLEYPDYFAEVFSTDDSARDLSDVFKYEIGPALAPIRAVLDDQYKLFGDYPDNEIKLKNELATANIRLEDVRDPWGTPYRPSFTVENEMKVFSLTSAGPDKLFGTEDDFSGLKMLWPYFRAYEEAIRTAVNDFHARTGGFVRDEQALRSELLRKGIDFASLADPWGHPYHLEFGVDDSRFTVTVRSAGPDGRYGTQRMPSNDDFSLATASIDYFAETSTRIDTALNQAYARDHVFPESQEQFEQILRAAGIQWEQLRDPWGHPYYATFRQEAIYADNVDVRTYQIYSGSRVAHTTITPVTRQLNFVYVRSAGEDGTEGTADDFSLGAFSRFRFEESASASISEKGAGPNVFSGSTGAISGFVTDLTGGVISGATVIARKGDSFAPIVVKTDDSGNYVLPNLPAGQYTVSISSKGFLTTYITEVPVSSSNVTKLDAILAVGSETQTITVSESVAPVETTSAALSGRVTGTQSKSAPPPNSTPRLREYFPETLFWQPELVTGKNGRAQIRVPLADNITTWKLSIIASSEDGEIGTADKEIRAFQPFFAEHDPPRFLTVGDEINLPVVLRNYLDRSLSISTVMKPEAWFSPLGPTTVSTTVRRKNDARALFKFRAIGSVVDGKQRITATAAETGDAIERKVTVRPNGEDRSETLSQVFSDHSRLDLSIPDGAISGSISGTLKIYPNLQAHLLESVEGIARRPAGCAEQVISTSYASLLLLRYGQISGGAPDPSIARARKNLELGYQRLLSYISEDGGVTYWGRGQSDAALTAYAMKFMSDAGEFISIDDSSIEKPLMWLVHVGQQENGRWIAQDWDGREDARRTAMLTAFVARMIATTKTPAQGSIVNSRPPADAAAAVNKALTFLEPEVLKFDEPYLLAAYGLASAGSGKKDRATESVKRLLGLEHREGDVSYWSLETNTPFYGWGLAGRIETTALVLQLLEKDGDTSAEERQLRSRALLFVLRNQDRYGVWYSTQATVNVLDAIGSLTSNSAATVPGNSSAGNNQATILVDGRQVLSADLPAPDKLTGPVFLDMGKFLSAGKHTVEINRQGGAPEASAQLVAGYYVPWPQGDTSEEVRRQEKSSEALRLNVHFDKPAATVGDKIVCDVNAERIGFRGYGMMLAEIGLPPGADVDRASLDRAMTESGWDINQYDVLPDRLVVYLWPKAGGTKFSFTFKQRFGMKALTTSSILYDYYNPEARVVVAPTEFNVR